MAAVLDPPVTPHGVSETLHSQGQAADVVPHLRRLLPAADTLRYRQADRRQPLPQPEARQALRGRHLDVDPFLLTSMPRLIRRVPAGVDVGEVVLDLPVDVIDNSPVQRLLV